METNFREILKKFVCEVCKKDFSNQKHKSTAKYCSIRCRNTGNSRESAEKRRKKLKKNSNGKAYKKYYGMHEHRFLIEEKLGRKLTFNEVVHHKDHDKLNNSIDNLVLMTRSEHTRHHSTKNRICEIDQCKRKHYSLGMCYRHYSKDYYRKSKDGNKL